MCDSIGSDFIGTNGSVSQGQVIHTRIMTLDRSFKHLRLGDDASIKCRINPLMTQLFKYWTQTRPFLF
jgi:hypothetical protein